MQLAACAVRTCPGAVRMNGRRRIHVARAVDPGGVRTHVIHAQHPIPHQPALDAEGPLLRVRIQQLIRIADQR